MIKHGRLVYTFYDYFLARNKKLADKAFRIAILEILKNYYEIGSAPEKMHSPSQFS